LNSILLVEDEKDIQFANKIILERRGGYKVRLAMNLAEARKAIIEAEPTTIVLDIMLPDGSGLDFLRELREEGRDIPVLLLTALGTAKEKVEGLRAGGDDYLAKPYDNDELLARLESLLRRTRRNIIQHGNLTVNHDTRRAYLNGEDLQLNRIEYNLLLLLVRNENKLVTAAELYKKAWEQPLNDNTGALHAQISKLRKKLHDSGYSITTKRGRGYVFEKE